MSKQTSFADMFELYLHNLSVLKHWTFIVATTEPDNMDLYAGMEHLAGIKERLFTPFKNGRVSIINQKILKRCWFKRDSRVRMYRCVSFDTQTVSYIEQYFKNATVPYEGFDDVLHLLKGYGFGIDCFPYSMENLMFECSQEESVEQTLFAYEMLCGENSGNARLCRKHAKDIISLYAKKDFEVLFHAKELFNMIYLSLLKMSEIQLTHSKWPIEKKMNAFLEFMNNEACRMMQPELNLAKLYFTDGNAHGFFGKIHSANKNILEQLKNMAWDLMHLRFMDYSCTMFNAKKGDVLIPYFFTYDRRLQHIRSCYSLKTLAINTRSRAVIPIYAFDAGVLDFVKEHCTFEKHQERKQKTPNVELLIDKCEKALTKLIDNEAQHPLP